MILFKNSLWERKICFGKYLSQNLFSVDIEKKTVNEYNHEFETLLRQVENCQKLRKTIDTER